MDNSGGIDALLIGDPGIGSLIISPYFKLLDTHSSSTDAYDWEAAKTKLSRSLGPHPIYVIISRLLGAVTDLLWDGSSSPRAIFISADALRLGNVHQSVQALKSAEPVLNWTMRDGIVVVLVTAESEASSWREELSTYRLGIDLVVSQSTDLKSRVATIHNEILARHEIQWRDRKRMKRDTRYLFWLAVGLLIFVPAVQDVIGNGIDLLFEHLFPRSTSSK